MREILFKGKRMDNGEWVEGCYMTDEKDRTTAYIGHIFGVDGGVLIHDMDFARVIPETICQYTGLTNNTKWKELSENEKEKFLSEWNYEGNRKNTEEDWNGKEIFEGDIFQAGDKGYIQRYIIAWNKKALEWSAECIGDPDYSLPLAIFGVEEIEVIGNIFDDPELVKGKST